MAQLRKRLTIAKIRSIKRPGRYADGGNLYLLVKKDLRKSWVFRYRDKRDPREYSYVRKSDGKKVSETLGRLRDKGLGPLTDVSLEQARKRAALLRAGFYELSPTDPIDSARDKRKSEQSKRAKSKTFGECVNAYIDSHRAGWRNAKHAQQWTNTLNTYTAALLPLPVSQIETAHVMNVLENIWTTKTETATRVRQRIECVLDWATARRYRDGENPARWRGHLDKLLPKPTKLKRVEARKALPYLEAGEFMRLLRNSEGIAARALEFQILTASRPGEACGARWTELDLDAKTWTVPADRMKAGKPHRIPLSDDAVSLLSALSRVDGGFVFPGNRARRSITTAAALAALKELRPDLHAHGFRSTFRDWAADRTSYAREIVEEALAHQLKDKAEAAYRRSDLLLKRARLMQDWAKYCRQVRVRGETVTPINERFGTV